MFVFMWPFVRPVLPLPLPLLAVAQRRTAPGCALTPAACMNGDPVLCTPRRISEDSSCA